jgi:hypothetical protein
MLGSNLSIVTIFYYYVTSRGGKKSVITKRTYCNQNFIIAGLIILVFAAKVKFGMNWTNAWLRPSNGCG